MRAGFNEDALQESGTSARTTATTTTTSTFEKVTYSAHWPFLSQCLHPTSPGGLLNFTLPTCQEFQESDFSRNAKIAIVGGGPGGVSVAKLLDDRGFRKVTLFEAQDRVGGKSRRYVDKSGSAHELGTCYLAGKYECITAWAQAMNLTEIWIDKSRLTSSDKAVIANMKPPAYADTNTQFADYAFRELHIAPDQFESRVEQAAQVYVQHWVATMGSMDHIFPSEQNVNKQALNNTFEEWLLQRNLSALIPLFHVSMAGQGYGSPSDMPALYGLMWNHPNLLLGRGTSEALHAHGHRMLLEGFQTLWERLIASSGVQVRLNTEISRIDREPQGAWITDKSGKREHFDWIVMAAPMPQALTLIPDATPEELAVFGSFNYHELSATMFDVSSMGNLPADVELFTWSDRLPSQTDYFRESLENGKIVREMYDADGDDGPVTLRHTANIKGHQDNIAGVLQISDFRATNAQLQAAVISDASAYGVQLQPLHTYRWTYMPFLNISDIVADRKPWRMWDLQGKTRTWWVGSYVSFESVADVLDYNLQLVNSRLCQ